MKPTNQRPQFVGDARNFFLETGRFPSALIQREARAADRLLRRHVIGSVPGPALLLAIVPQIHL